MILLNKTAMRKHQRRIDLRGLICAEAQAVAGGDVVFVGNCTQHVVQGSGGKEHIVVCLK